jgi:hypothetical protein
MGHVNIPTTEAEQYLAVKDMMATNLCSKGVFALPSESLAKLTSKILNIRTDRHPYITYEPLILRFHTGGTISTSNSAAGAYPATVTITPPSDTFDWGMPIGSKTSVASDYRLLSATIRASWYGSVNYNNYTSVHFIQAFPNANALLTDDTWANTWQYYITNRPYYNSYPDTSFNSSGSSSYSTRGAMSFSLYPYSNSTTYYYWNPNYLQLAYCTWLVKRPDEPK